MPRFVILHHIPPPDYREGSHFDLMLETDGTLLTWSLPQLPQVGLPMTATRLPDHRVHYLDYEGPISNNRGDVRRVAKGEFEWLQRTEGRIVAILHDMKSLQIELNLQQYQVWLLVTSLSPPRLQ